MSENEIEELKKEVQNFIRRNEVSFILNGKPLKISKINQITIYSIEEGNFFDDNNYSFEGGLEVFIPAPTEGDEQNLFGKFTGYAKIEIKQENGKLKEIIIIKVSPIIITEN